MLVAEQREMPSTVREALQLDEPMAYYVERVRRAGDREIAVERSWFPSGIAHDFLEHDLTGSLYELLEVYERKPVEATEYIAPLLDEECAALLHVDPLEPLLHVQRTARDHDGVPVEHSNDVFNPAHVQFVVTRRIG